jgi:hypothetical protein
VPLFSCPSPIGRVAAAVLFATALSLSLGLAHAQAAAAQTAAPPQLSPEAAYAQALQPLTLTRTSVANWSETELAALHIAVEQARVACVARPAAEFTGDTLIALARLCSLGQQWPAVSEAAGRYLHDHASQPTPLLSQAYALAIDAALHQRDEAAALAASQALLATLPYDATADQAINEALRYLQLGYPMDALRLCAAREPILLAALRAEPSPSADSAGLAAPALSRATLYADGLAYAALEQFVGQPADAAALAISIVEALDAALATQGAVLPPDDAIQIAAARRQYALLGKPLPAIPITLSLYAPGEAPRINTDYGSSTALFLFPPWCAQCVRMGQSFMSSLFRLSDRKVHIDGLLAQDPPPVAASPDLGMSPSGLLRPKRGSGSSSKPGSGRHGHPAPAAERAPAAAPKSAAELLQHTPTLVVPVRTLEQFAATDFPLLIATDSKGIVRFIEPAPEDALQPGGFLDQVTAHIAAQWPPAH